MADSPNPDHSQPVSALVSEFAAEVQGGLSPFGEDLQFPLPTDELLYRHPSAADRPRLAGELAE